MANKDIRDLPKDLVKLTKFINRTTEQATLAMGYEMTKKLIEDTPVQTGSLRGNWHLNPDGRAPAYRYEPTASDSQALDKATRVADRAKRAKHVTISNASPYLLKQFKYSSIKQSADIGRKRGRKAAQKVFDKALATYARQVGILSG